MAAGDVGAVAGAAAASGEDRRAALAVIRAFQLTNRQVQEAEEAG